MPKRSVSVFLLVHGIIYPPNESRFEEENRIVYSIGCEPLPPNVTLYAPDILAKPYYENKVNTRNFITRKMAKWDKKGDFSDFIAERLTNFERKETAKMYDILTQRDKDDIAGYEQKKRMPMDVKMSRRTHAKGAILKEGITWRKHDCYIPEKRYVLPKNYNDPNERTILLTMEEIAEDGTRRLSRMLPIQGSIRNLRMNLIEMTEHLKMMCGLTGPNDTLTLFDFSCFTIDFPTTGIEQYQPNLLSYQITHEPDNSTRIIYGTMRKDVISEMRNAEVIGQSGVMFGDTPTSDFTLSSQEEDSEPDMTRVVSAAVHPTPELHVIVPESANSYIQFGRIHHQRNRSRSRSRNRRSSSRSSSRGRARGHPMSQGGGRLKRTRLYTRRNKMF